MTTHPSNTKCPSTLLQEWQRLTREGLEASAHCPMHALACYEQALQVANQLMSQADPPLSDDERLAAFVASHLNLSDCYHDMGQPACAAVTLSHAHRKLVALAKQTDENEPLRLLTCRHMHQTFCALHEHCARYGTHAAIDRTLRESGANEQAPPGTWLH